VQKLVALINLPRLPLIGLHRSCRNRSNHLTGRGFPGLIAPNSFPSTVAVLPSKHSFIFLRAFLTLPSTIQTLGCIFISASFVYKRFSQSQLDQPPDPVESVANLWGRETLKACWQLGPATLSTKLNTATSFFFFQRPKSNNVRRTTPTKADRLVKNVPIKKAGNVPQGLDREESPENIPRKRF